LPQDGNRKRRNREREEGGTVKRRKVLEGEGGRGEGGVWGLLALCTTSKVLVLQLTRMQATLALFALPAGIIASLSHRIHFTAGLIHILKAVTRWLIQDSCVSFHTL
jgi:hypothetical protein